MAFCWTAFFASSAWPEADSYCVFRVAMLFSEACSFMASACAVWVHLVTPSTSPADFASSALSRACFAISLASPTSSAAFSSFDSSWVRWATTLAAWLRSS